MTARDPTSDPPPNTTPQAPPYPASGTGYPTYQLGSAPVGSPVTAVPAYGGTGRRARAVALGVLATALVVLLCGVCGIAGFLLSRGTSGPEPASAPAPTQATASPARAGAPARTNEAAEPGRTNEAAEPAPRAGAHTVVYELTGSTDTALVTYAVNAGASPTDVDLPWRKQVTVDSRSFLVTVIAVHLRGGPLTCRILVDGREIAKNTSDNAVTCTHLVVN